MKLPRVTGEKTVKALQRAGFSLVHVRGSYHYLHHPEHDCIVTVPVHARRLHQKPSNPFSNKPGFQVRNSPRSCNICRPVIGQSFSGRPFALNTFFCSKR
jgi:predicted RNA binding protein YcfA (HicA-like mRNA interferase family)